MLEFFFQLNLQNVSSKDQKVLDTAHVTIVSVISVNYFVVNDSHFF